MKRLHFIPMLFFAYSHVLPAQILDLESTTDGVLIPRMTLTQRNNISAPSEGLLIYQTTEPKGFYFNNGSTWQEIGGSTTISLPSIMSASAIMFTADTERFGMMGVTSRTDEAETQHPVPRSGKLKNFYVHNSSALNAGSVITIRLRKNGLDTGVSWTYTPADGITTKSNTVTEIDVSAGDLINFAFDETQNVNPGAAYFNVLFELH